MTLEQKATLITASGGWNKISAGEQSVSAFAPSDGARGLKVEKNLSCYGAPTTAFPAPSGIARSFDTELGARVADVIGREARALGVNAVETPEGGIKTAPSTDGRRRLSEDAYLSGKMLAAYVRGYEHSGVAAVMGIGESVADRNISASEKRIRETALLPYEMAVKEGEPSMIKIARGALDGVALGENKHLLRGIVGTEWQYGGTVLSYDDGDMNIARAMSLGAVLVTSDASGAEAKKLAAAVTRHNDILTDIAAGNAKEAQLASAVASGEAVPESMLDAALERLLAAVDEKGVEPVQSTGKYSSYPFNHAVVFDEQAHATLAYRAAAESTVLLKNSDGVLPIRSSERVAVVGEYAFLPLATAVADEDFVPLDTDTAASLVSRSGLNVIGTAKGFSRSSADNASVLIAEAKEQVRDADKVVVYMGNLAERGGGATPENQLELLRELRRAGNAKIIAVYFGETHDMSWNDLCDAVLLAGDPGQGGAKAIYAILRGEINPSAKLAESICDTEVPHDVEKGLYGYNACRALNVSERYPFGYGLSYTSFEYSNMSVDCSGVSFTLKNTGRFAGAEIAQLYIGRENSAAWGDKKELRGFKKIYLEAGESKRVNIPFDSRAFRYYNTDTFTWETEGGYYQIFVASSARAFELIDEIEIEASGAPVPGTVVETDPKKKKKKQAPKPPRATSYVPDTLYPEDRDVLTFEGEEKISASSAESTVSTFAPATSDGETVATAKYTVVRHTAAEARVAGVGRLFADLKAYVEASGVTVADDELRELFAAFASSRVIALRSSDTASACAAVRALAECFGAVLSTVAAAPEDKTLVDAHRDLIDAVDVAASDKEKQNIALIFGSDNLSDMLLYMGDVVNYTGSETKSFALALGERKLCVPSNMWFVCVIPDDVPAKTAEMCVVRLRASKSAETVSTEGGAVTLHAYDLTLNAFAETVETERESSYLSEKYWRKIDKLAEYISAKMPFSVSNKTANAMEKFVCVCVAGGAEQTEALDCVISALLLCRISAESADLFSGEETFTEHLDALFGADKDDRCRELVRLKGIK